jgi:hypothetical protein
MLVNADMITLIKHGIRHEKERLTIEGAVSSEKIVDN